ncbi:hypothetical protein H920_11996 [Fukomys damarensis]|uniref:Uncharacterized protein n=1 Tax=Fukomys damarensis TaxID=885580 RepID=A0A091D699_FUKDA|nr:hypothetical protein H920_11996 [Fukomys damarensis]
MEELAAPSADCSSDTTAGLELPVEGPAHAVEGHCQPAGQLQMGCRSVGKGTSGTGMNGPRFKRTQKYSTVLGVGGPPATLGHLSTPMATSMLADPGWAAEEEPTEQPWRKGPLLPGAQLPAPVLRGRSPAGSGHPAAGKRRSRAVITSLPAWHPPAQC